MADKCPVKETPFDAGYFSDPYTRYAQLREEARVQRIQLPSGIPVWLVTRYEDVYAGLNDKRLVRDRRYANSDYTGELLPQIVRHGNLHMEDGELHARLRRFMNFAFTPKRLHALRPRMEEVTEQLLEKLADGGGGDLMADFAEPMPIAIIVDIIGIPRDMTGDFHMWSDTIMCGAQADAQEAARDLIAYARELIARKHSEPGDDLLSHWVHGTDETGTGLTDQEIIGMTFFLLLGGYITTFGSFGTAMVGLLTHPEKAGMLRKHPELVPGAVEEFLRWDGSAQNAIRRFAIEEMEFAGTRMAAGDTVLLSIGSANRDPRRFPEPDALRFDREDYAHLSFGRGAHNCPGKELARIELRVMIARLLAKFPDLALAGPPDEIDWRPNYIFRAPRRLSVTV